MEIKIEKKNFQNKWVFHNFKNFETLNLSKSEKIILKSILRKFFKYSSRYKTNNYHCIFKAIEITYHLLKKRKEIILDKKYIQAIFHLSAKLTIDIPIDYQGKKIEKYQVDILKYVIDSCKSSNQFSNLWELFSKTYLDIYQQFQDYDKFSKIKRYFLKQFYLNCDIFFALIFEPDFQLFDQMNMLDIFLNCKTLAKDYFFNYNKNFVQDKIKFQNLTNQQEKMCFEYLKKINWFSFHYSLVDLDNIQSLKYHLSSN